MPSAGCGVLKATYRDRLFRPSVRNNPLLSLSYSEEYSSQIEPLNHAAKHDEASPPLGWPFR